MRDVLSKIVAFAKTNLYFCHSDLFGRLGYDENEGKVEKPNNYLFALNRLNHFSIMYSDKHDDTSYTTVSWKSILKA